MAVGKLVPTFGKLDAYVAKFAVIVLVRWRVRERVIVGARFRNFDEGTLHAVIAVNGMAPGGAGDFVGGRVVVVEKGIADGTGRGNGELPPLGLAVAPGPPLGVPLPGPFPGAGLPPLRKSEYTPPPLVAPA